MLEILQHFAIAGSWLDITLKYWSLQQNAGNVATMLFSCLFPYIDSLFLIKYTGVQQTHYFYTLLIYGMPPQFQIVEGDSQPQTRTLAYCMQVG